MKLKRWHYRQNLFKLGFCGVLLSLVLACIGYVAPAWQNTGGLWIYPQLQHPLPDWLQAVRVLETVSVVAVVGCIMVEVYQDMCPRSSSVSDNHLVEVIAVLAGVCGLGGVLVFAVQAHSYGPGDGPFGPCRSALFWAWGLQTVGSLLLLPSALALAYSRATNRGRSERRMQVVAFRRTAPVGLNPYFLSRCVPAVRIASVTPVQPDSQA